MCEQLQPRHPYISSIQNRATVHLDESADTFIYMHTCKAQNLEVQPGRFLEAMSNHVASISQLVISLDIGQYLYSVNKDLGCNSFIGHTAGEFLISVGILQLLKEYHLFGRQVSLKFVVLSFAILSASLFTIQLLNGPLGFNIVSNFRPYVSEFTWAHFP